MPRGFMHPHAAMDTHKIHLLSTPKKLAKPTRCYRCTTIVPVHGLWSLIGPTSIPGKKWLGVCWSCVQHLSSDEGVVEMGLISMGIDPNWKK